MFVPERVSFKTRWYLDHFDYAAKVRKLEDLIKVDDKIDGCPMNVPAFIEVLNKYLKQFSVV